MREASRATWVAVAVLVAACGDNVRVVDGAGGATTASVGSSVQASAAAGSGGFGGAATSSSAATGVGGQGGAGGAPSGCGAVELCDPGHLGLDDDCNGQVDEACSCVPGQAHSCFMGDPAFRHAPGCFAGTELCTPAGVFGPCTGGVHATESCFNVDPTGPHAITTAPFRGLSLATGLGVLPNVVPGSAEWTVACPTGVSACPKAGGANGADWFVPIQSGEYAVTFSAELQGGGDVGAGFPLIVGAVGLRVELSWEHTVADEGVDLDLHVHQPGGTAPWGISPGVAQDCTWSNCTMEDFAFNAAAPSWFGDAPPGPPAPVNWWLDPDPAKNYCVSPHPTLGCHNPRLDLDNIMCDASLDDPLDPLFCAPENINIDYPPMDQWTRVAVHYYSSHQLLTDVHPTVRVFCDGALSALLGPAGFYDPETAVTFEPSDGASVATNRFWPVADVVFQVDPFGDSHCTVQPIYSDPITRTPFLTNDASATVAFLPSYPPLP